MDTANICDDAQPPGGACGNENVPDPLYNNMNLGGQKTDSRELRLTDMTGVLTSSEDPSTAGENECSTDDLMSSLSINDLNESLPTDHVIQVRTPETPRTATISHEEATVNEEDQDPLDMIFHEPARHEIDFISTGHHYEGEYEENLEISDEEEEEEAVVCNYENSCHEEWCQEYKRCLKCADIDYKGDCHSCEKAIKYIQDHQNRECSEVRCRVPFCKALTDFPLLQLSATLQRSGQLLWKLTVQEIKESDARFTQLHDSSPGNLEAALDCDFICHLGSFGHFSTVLVQNQSHYRVLKKIVSQDTNMLTHVLTHVSSSSCPNIIQLFWTVECIKHVYVCLPFEAGGSLEEYVSDLTAPQIGCCLRQFINALTYLHQDSKKIVYLLWTCANILINFGDSTPKPDFVVKLSNFSAAVHVEKAITDPEVIEDIYFSVIPAVIIPPELFSDGPCLMSDMWGLGCIAYELVNKHRVHHDLRHCPPEYTREMVQNRSIPPAYSSEFEDFMSRCFEVNAENRANLDELYALTL